MTGPVEMPEGMPERLAEVWRAGYRAGYAAALANVAAARVADQQRQPSFVCPDCGARSHHPQDLLNGYCGRCHAFTGSPPGPVS